MIGVSVSGGRPGVGVPTETIDVRVAVGEPVGVSVSCSSRREVGVTVVSGVTLPIGDAVAVGVWVSSGGGVLVAVAD
jgi:hypothetical protein